MRRSVVNSTPLIALAKCGQLEILRNMYDEVIIPDAVFKEICAVDDVVSKEVRDSLSWIQVRKIQHPEDKKFYRTRLHDGEVEVIILSQEIHPDVVIIDDLAARSTAQYYKLPLTGTLGLLIKAKKKGIIDEVMPIVDKMRENHIYYSDHLIELVKRKAEE